MPVPARYARFARLLAVRDRLTELLARRPRPLRPARRARLAAEALEDRLVPDGRPLPLPTIFVGTGDGPPLVRGFDVLTGQMTFERLLADPGFAGGVRVAAADFTGEGTRTWSPPSGRTPAPGCGCSTGRPAGRCPARSATSWPTTRPSGAGSRWRPPTWTGTRCRTW